MKKFTCPYCYGEHDILTCNMKCSYNVPGQNEKCVSDVKKDPRGLIPNKDKKRCLKCKSASKAVYCNYANKEIPSDFLDGSSLSIALLGAKASGKSNYIGVLINELRQKMTRSFNCILNITSSEESKMYYDNFYYKRLYVEGVPVPQTDTGQIPPLIFPLRFMDKRDHITNVAALSFYDTAGENLNSTRDILENNKYLPNAEGIILLLDPLQISTVREKLKGKMSERELPSQNTNVSEILSRIVKNIREVKNIKGKIKIPLALTFTKIDALEKYGLLREDSCLLGESEHLSRGVFVQSDFENVNIEMQDLLENWLDAELVQQMKNFENYAFFGVSALGDVPVNGRLVSKINPRRVLDPLLWILAEYKYIKRVKK